MLQLSITVVAATSLPPTLTTPVQILRGFVEAPGGMAEGRLLGDGHSLRLIVSLAPDDLEKQLLKQLDRIDIAVSPLPRRRAETRLTAPFKISEFRIDKQPGGWLLELVVVTAADALRQHVLRGVPPVVPTSFTAKRFRKAEAALLRGDLRQARLTLEALKQEYTLRAWAALRTGDISLLENRMTAACSEYYDVVKRFPTRTAGLVAHLRAFVLPCPTVPVDTVDWPVLLARLLYVDGELGRFLRREAQWALDWAHKPQHLVVALKLLSQRSRRRRRLGGAPQIRSTVARAIRLSKDPFERLRIYQTHRRWVHNQPEADGLLLMVGRSMVELDLGSHALGILTRLSGRRRNGATKRSWTARNGDAQAMQLSRLAYECDDNPLKARAVDARYRKLFGEPMPSRRTARATTDPNIIAELWQQLESRLKRLWNAVPKQQGPEGGLAAMD